MPPASTGFAPRDRQLGLRASGALSPGLAEMSALAGAEVSFTRAAALMAGLAGVTLSPRTIERSAEAAGAGRVDERQLTGLRAAQQIGIVVHRADGNLGDGQDALTPTMGERVGVGRLAP